MSTEGFISILITLLGVAVAAIAMLRIKNSKIANTIAVGIIIVCILGIAFVTYLFFYLAEDSLASSEVVESQTIDSSISGPEEQQKNTEDVTEVESEEWSEWMESLPAGVTAAAYDIQEKYMYRIIETMESAEPVVAGWEQVGSRKEAQGEGTWTGWTFEERVGYSDVKRKTQYRYRDLITIQSFSSYMDGWIQVNTAWVEAETGTISYVANWPSGFNTSSSIVDKYSNNAKTAMETTSSKTVVNEFVEGYIYYHWCRGTHSGGPTNRLTKSSRSSEFSSWHAFFDTKDPATLMSAPDKDGSYQYPNSSCCVDSYWYFYVPVYKQTYTIYQKEYTYEKWGEWSSFSDKQVYETSTRQVEPREMYRYLEVKYIEIYQYERKCDWRECEDQKQIPEGDDVETKKLYRYRKLV